MFFEPAEPSGSLRQRGLSPGSGDGDHRLQRRHLLGPLAEQTPRLSDDSGKLKAGAAAGYVVLSGTTGQ